MQRSKRSRTNIIDVNHEKKRRKTNGEYLIRLLFDIFRILVIFLGRTNQSITVFEDLSNELIYELFDYLHSHHAFESFYDLNQRFQNFFLHSHHALHVNLSSISKPIFRRYLTQIIRPHPNRIQSLRICNHFAVDIYLFLLPLFNHFSRLEQLIIHNIELEHIEATVNSLFSLPMLSSLVIKSVGLTRISPRIYRTILHLPALKYCHLHINIKRNLASLPRATTGSSPIEHLIIDNEVSFNQIGILLSYVPRLRRLSFGQVICYGISRTFTNVATLNYLIDLSLNVRGISLNEFESLVRCYFRQVEILRFTTISTWYYSREMEHLNAVRWEQIISTNLPNLRIFDFQQKYQSRHHPVNDQEYQTKINEFNSLFWMQHQWFFVLQSYKTKHYKNYLFYSTSPYK